MRRTFFQSGKKNFFEKISSIDFQLFLVHSQGDISLVQNYVNLHARTRYEDWPEVDRKRHLLRLWLSFDGARPVHDDIIRDHQFGILEENTVLQAPLEVI